MFPSGVIRQGADEIRPVHVRHARAERPVHEDDDAVAGRALPGAVVAGPVHRLAGPGVTVDARQIATAGRALGREPAHAGAPVRTAETDSSPGLPDSFAAWAEDHRADSTARAGPAVAGGAGAGSVGPGATATGCAHV
ncbi:hypothetical protein [Streptomyces sp. DH37]|uniref:hypothetical protein n=1 Tax=Streptomyces sp. DH37 TaxID=3040122 RepID=UPI00244318D7|nr:hypothetical protein [Streptomyces sp. DH37]MDG9701496.1 hypothetical protein [Streptomyces sp. DH37]